MKRFFATLAASLFAVLVSVSAAQAQSIDPLQPRKPRFFRAGLAANLRELAHS